MGDILERELGQYTQAAGCYRKLVELQGDSKQGYPAAQIRLAEMYRDRFFDLDRSETYFREALEILEYQGQSPEAASIRERIAEIEKRREDYRSVSQ
jgi:tetratricopeptide (TPR) repeat protein